MEGLQFQLFMASLVMSSSFCEERRATPISSDILLSQWKSCCHLERAFVSGSNFTSHVALVLSCDFQKDGYWTIDEYKQWVTANEKELKYHMISDEKNLRLALNFTCSEKSAKVSLPWPMKADYLWNIQVRNCTVIDYLKWFNITTDGTDTLNVLELVDVDLLVEPGDFFRLITEYNKTSSQYRCGGTQLEKFVRRNVKQVFKKPTFPQGQHDISVQNSQFSKPNTNNASNQRAKVNISSNFASLSEGTPLLESVETINNGTVNLPKMSTGEWKFLQTIAKFSQQHQKLQRRCVYGRLRYIDESFSTAVSKHHNHFMTEGSQYPELRYYNVSHSRLAHLSSVFLTWRRYFPKLMYLDLSYNKIKHFTTFSDNGLLEDGIGVIDLRHNNITTLTSDDLDTLRFQSNTVYIDIRNNPIHCDCKMTHFVEAVRQNKGNVLNRYDYLSRMKCAGPEAHKDKTLARLQKGFCESFELVVLAEPLVAMSCCLVVMVVALIVFIRYRKEIMILAFTRLHISLPCRTIIKDGDKTYDAFIAYSEQDGGWVFNTLLPRLEEQPENNGPGFKLCIHHRDFPVGGCIADNISDKVRDSNHTILILSNEFLQSQWCRYELKAAFTQSLTEKKRHLIMIIKEELDKRLVDQELKRCLQTFTYVKADDRLFWDKIVYALSDRRKLRGRLGNNNHVQLNQHQGIQNERQVNDAPRGRHHDAADVNAAFGGENGIVRIGAIQDGVWHV